MKAARAAWLLTHIVLSATLAHAEQLTGDKEITLKADTVSVDTPTESYRAQGGVEISQPGVSLLSDSVVYRRLTGEAFAEGEIFMERGGDTLKGRRLTLNLLTQKGELLNGELFVKKSNFRIWAKRVEKTGPADYRMERGTFTTCDGDRPSWRFEAKRVDVTLEEFATARDAVFYVGDVPLFYTPYLVFPANTERQSGLLLPRLGFSSKKGFYLNQPYYWAIDPSQDATFNLDIETSRGYGAGVDYRYLRPHGSEGRLQAFGIYDTNESRFRGELEERHLELLNPNLTLTSNIHLITDRDYYLDYGELSGEYNRQLLESNVAFDRRWERYGLFGQVRYTEDLEAVNNKATLQRLPALGFVASGEKLGPLFFSMDSGFTNFQRETGATGQRLDLHPRLTWYAKPGGLDFSLYGGYLQRMYNAQGDSGEKGWLQVGQADAGAVASLPLERIYDGTTRHLMTPSLEYVFVQQRHDAELPFFDYGDRVLGQGTLWWSLSNQVTRKYAREGMPDEYRDLLYLKLSQGYQFSGPRRDLRTLVDSRDPLVQSVTPRDLLTLVDEGHRLTDLMLEGVATPVQNVSVAFDGRYNMNDAAISTANLALGVKGEGRTETTVGYRHSRGQLDYMEGRFTFPVGSKLTADLLGRYSLDKGGFLESRYAVEYKRQCWSVILAYSDRVGSRDVPSEQQVTINFTLAGLGALGPVRAF